MYKPYYKGRKATGFVWVYFPVRISENQPKTVPKTNSFSNFIGNISQYYPHILTNNYYRYILYSAYVFQIHIIRPLSLLTYACLKTLSDLISIGTYLVLRTGTSLYIIHYNVELSLSETVGEKKKTKSFWLLLCLICLIKYNFQFK